MGENLEVRQIFLGNSTVIRISLSGLGARYVDFSGEVNLTLVGQDAAMLLKDNGLAGEDFSAKKEVRFRNGRITQGVQFKTFTEQRLVMVQEQYLGIAQVFLKRMCGAGGEAHVTIGEQHWKMVL